MPVHDFCLFLNVELFVFSLLNHKSSLYCVNCDPLLFICVSKYFSQFAACVFTFLNYPTEVLNHRVNIRIFTLFLYGLCIGLKTLFYSQAHKNVAYIFL